MKKKRFWFIHASSIFLLLSIILFFITIKHTTITLAEGDSIRSLQIFKQIHRNNHINLPIKLVKFKIQENAKSLTYISHVAISNQTFIIKVNKPLRWKGLTFYQRDWRLGIDKLTFSFEGKKYNVFETKKNQLVTHNNQIFYFYPTENVTTNQNIIYEWITKKKNSDEISEKGQFVFHPQKISKNEMYLFQKFKFRIIKQSFHFISVFDVYYKPLNLLVALSSILFLLALLFSLIRTKKNDI